MERHIQQFVSEWAALKDQDVLAFLRDSMPYVASSNLPDAALSQFLSFAERCYQRFSLELLDDPLGDSQHAAARWQLVCSQANSGLVVPETLQLGGADFIRSSRGIIRDLDVYFDFNDVVAVQRLLAPASVTLDESVAVLKPGAPEGRRQARATYRHSGLSDSALDDIAARLKQVMVEQQLYLQTDLNLARLADHLGVRSDYLSQVISQRCGSSFYQLLSRHRVEEARQRLLQQPDASVIEIAFAVGFNSKSVFYSEFRKHVGMTPAAYRKERRGV